jgi:hypothetical protein
MPARCCKKKLFSISQLSRMSVNLLLGIFERKINNHKYYFFKTLKAIIIKAKAILDEDLLVSATGRSCSSLQAFGFNMYHPNRHF